MAERLTWRRLSRLELAGLLLAATASHVAAARTAAPLLPPPDSPQRAELVATELAAGRLALAGSQLVPALQHYTRALALAPESTAALNGLAVCYDRLGRFDLSRTYYEIALGIDAAAPDILNNYGYSLYLQGEYAQAQRFLSLAIAAGDGDVQARALRSLVLVTSADAHRAQAQALRQVAARADMAPDAAEASDGGARIVRTSAHEVRLVLAAPPAAVALSLVADAPVVSPVGLAPQLAAAMLPIPALAADAVAASAAAAPRVVAEAAPVPAWIQAIIDLANITSGETDPDWPAAIRLALGDGAPQTPYDPLWDAHQILDAGPAAHCGTSEQALRQWALQPAPAPTARPRRFDQPFTSDDARLNRFAERLHQSPRAVTLAHLRAARDRAGIA